MGRNRLTFTPQGAYDVDGAGGIDDIPQNQASGDPTRIVMRESNIPVMTMTIDFEDNDGDQAEFVIQDVRLSINEEVGGVNVEGSMDMHIHGTGSIPAITGTPTASTPIALMNGAINRLETRNLRLTFTQGENSAIDNIDLDDLDVGDGQDDELDPGDICRAPADRKSVV